MAPRVADITPVVPVSDLDEAVGFFGDTLGFEIGHRFPGFAYVSRDGCGLRLIAANGPGVNMDDPARQMGVYVDVVDLDALYASMKAVLPPDRVRPPFDQPYGQREFHVYYEGLQLIFGETVGSAP